MEKEVKKVKQANKRSRRAWPLEMLWQGIVHITLYYRLPVIPLSSFDAITQDGFFYCEI